MNKVVKIVIIILLVIWVIAGILCILITPKIINTIEKEGLSHYYNKLWYGNKK